MEFFDVNLYAKVFFTAVIVFCVTPVLIGVVREDANAQVFFSLVWLASMPVMVASALFWIWG